MIERSMAFEKKENRKREYQIRCDNDDDDFDHEYIRVKGARKGNDKQ